MFTIKQRREVLSKLPLQYLVYYCKGEIKVKSGWAYGGNFYPENKKPEWMTKIPQVPMRISSRGKVYVIDAKDIPTAAQMIREAYKEKRPVYEQQFDATIRNMKILEATS